jgi:hypothetical protein
LGGHNLASARISFRSFVNTQLKTGIRSVSVSRGTRREEESLKNFGFGIARVELGDNIDRGTTVANLEEGEEGEEGSKKWVVFAPMLHLASSSG